MTDLRLPPLSSELQDLRLRLGSSGEGLYILGALPKMAFVAFKDTNVYSHTPWLGALCYMSHIIPSSNTRPMNMSDNSHSVVVAFSRHNGTKRDSSWTSKPNSCLIIGGRFYWIGFEESNLELGACSKLPRNWWGLSWRYCTLIWGESNISAMTSFGFCVLKVQVGLLPYQMGGARSALCCSAQYNIWHRWCSAQQKEEWIHSKLKKPKKNFE